MLINHVNVKFIENCCTNTFYTRVDVSYFVKATAIYYLKETFYYFNNAICIAIGTYYIILCTVSIIITFYSNTRK